MKKDWQRSKVYKAENETFCNYISGSPDRLTLYFACIIESDEFKTRFKNPIIFLKFFKKSKYSMFDYSSRTIFIGKEQLQKPTILHELSHAVCKNPMQPYHGKNFCKRYLWFVRTFLEEEYYFALKESFDKYFVKY